MPLLVKTSVGISAAIAAAISATRASAHTTNARRYTSTTMAAPQSTTYANAR
jgi:hypothetical protein